VTVLADHQIAALCVAPTTWLDQDLFDHLKYQGSLISDGVYRSPKDQHRLNAQIVKELEAQCTHAMTAEQLAESGWVPMIEPFVGESVRDHRVYITDSGMCQIYDRCTPEDVAGRGLKIIFDEEGRRLMYYRPTKLLSYGLSSAGYDVRLTEDVSLFTNINSTIIDPKNFDDRCLIKARVIKESNGIKYVILPPNSYLLGTTVEYFRIPRDVMVIAVGKSTYARSGVQVNVTPIEPGFEGNIVIEIANSTGLPVKIYIGEGVAQFIFHPLSEACTTSYADRGGKYQGQRGLQLPIV
jgi:dCTP deaminase